MPMPAYKVLVIDDSEIDQLITTLLLRKHGVLDVHVASGAEDGLLWIRDNQSLLQDGLIILLDVHMPEMDGFEFLHAFQSMDYSVQQLTRVFMLSSTIDPKDLQRATGFSQVKTILNKPLSAINFLQHASRG